MKRALTFLFACAAAAIVLSWPSQSPAYAADHVVVKYRATSYMSASVKTQPIGKRLNATTLTVPTGKTVDQYVTELKKNPEVSWVEADTKFTTQTTTPNDLYYPQQNYLRQIGLPAAWDITHGSNSVIVGVLDTGIDGLHEDLNGHILAGYNFVTSAAIPANTNSDDNGHGTAMSGIIGASSNNSVGMTGIDWQANLMPIKVLDSSGSGDDSAVANGIVYAADNGVRVLNMSIGAASDMQLVHDAINYALSKNVVLVAASGNSGAAVMYPAAYSGVLAVGSVNSSGVRSSFSDYGPELGIVTPGEGIYTSVIVNETAYGAVSGTSPATAVGSGVAALIASASPSSSYSDIIHQIESSTQRLISMQGQSFSNEYGYGLAQPYATLANIPAYSASWVSQSHNVTAMQSQPEILTVSYRNTGSYTWQKGVVRLGLVNTDGSWKSTPYLLASSWPYDTRPANLNEDTVAPGDVGTFTFSISNPSLAAGNYRLDVGLVAEGVTWFSSSTHAYWDVTVNPPYSATWVSQSHNVTVTQAQPEVMTISYRNTGSFVWQKGVVRLGLLNQDGSWKSTAYPLASSWPYDTRLANLNEDSVAPGSVGSFSFSIADPAAAAAAGNYRLDAGLVAEGVTWFPATTHAYWDVTVPTQYAASWVTQSHNVVAQPNQPEVLTISYQNTGSVTWKKGTVRLGLLNQDGSWKSTPYPLASSWPYATRPANLNEDSVAPGQTGTFTFAVSNPSLAAGNYRLDVGLVAEGVTWFAANTHAYWDVTVS